MKTNSNTYTIVYSAILVVIVAFLLAFVSSSLKPQQDANVALDKKKQILYALNLRGLSDEEAAAQYNKVVVADRIIDAEGKTLEPGTAGGEQAGFRLNGGSFKTEGKLALFECTINGETKYVMPVYGQGLWGGINGYIALNADRQTVYGAYFNHEGETAGLGAEIKDSQEWQEKFHGKKLFKDGSDDFALSVMKNVDDQATQVDAVTGATLTSDGVSEMLHEGLGNYKAFLKAQ